MITPGIESNLPTFGDATILAGEDTFKAMYRRLEIWQLTQLQRLASLDPEHAEKILNTVWTQYPGLYEQLVLSALEQRHLSVEESAKRLGVSEDECVARLKMYRKSLENDEPAAIVHEPGQAARVAGGIATVWEIVRMYRKMRSVEALVDAFPSLTTGELGAALDYAQRHAEEIEGFISRYEEALEKRRTSYPFAAHHTP